MKNELRKKFRSLRDNLNNRAEMDKKITRTVLDLDIFRSAETVLLYYPSGSEVSTLEIFSACQLMGKKIAFPLCLDRDGTMDFFIVKGESDFEKGMYGIYEPKKALEKLADTYDSICFVPGLSFDKRGYRLGYGKGYYDRYLSTFNGISVGLCYDSLVTDSLPADCYDKKVSYLITDKKIYNINFKEDLKNG